MAPTRGEQIRRARRQHKLSQQELADATGVGLRTIGRIEKGEVSDSAGIPVLEAYLGIDTWQPDATPSPAEPTLRSASDVELAAELIRRLGERAGDDRDRRWPGADGPPERVRWRTGDAPTPGRTSESDERREADG